MNDPFFHGQANLIAARLIASHSSTQERLNELYHNLFQRDPTADEMQRVSEFLTKYPGPESNQWAAITRVLLASNEFLHID